MSFAVITATYVLFYADQNLHKGLVQREKTLADAVTELDGDDKKWFLVFASGMLQWLPEDEDGKGAP